MEINSFALYKVAEIRVEQQTGLCDFSVTLNTAHLNPGLYIVRMVFSNGEIALTRVEKR
jgi:hypothetical protein